MSENKGSSSFQRRYYAARCRPPSPRAIADEALKATIVELHARHFGVYGARKLWRVLQRAGIEVGRDRVARLMASLGLAGATRLKRVPTTIAAPLIQRPADLVERVFSAPAPNRLWVADLTYVWTRAGFSSADFETVNGLFKTELIHRHRPWRTVEQVELATARWVASWNRERLHGACGDVPPAEFEAAYWQSQEAPIAVA